MKKQTMSLAVASALLVGGSGAFGKRLEIEARELEPLDLNLYSGPKKKKGKRKRRHRRSR